MAHTMFFSIFSDTFLFITNTVRSTWKSNNLSCQSCKSLLLKRTMSETRDGGFRTILFHTHLLPDAYSHTWCSQCLQTMLLVSLPWKGCGDFQWFDTRGRDPETQSWNCPFIFNTSCVHCCNSTFLVHCNKSNCSKTCSVPLTHN